MASEGLSQLRAQLAALRDLVGSPSWDQVRRVAEPKECSLSRGTFYKWMPDLAKLEPELETAGDQGAGEEALGGVQWPTVSKAVRSLQLWRDRPGKAQRSPVSDDHFDLEIWRQRFRAAMGQASAQSPSGTGALTESPTAGDSRAEVGDAPTDVEFKRVQDVSLRRLGVHPARPEVEVSYLRRAVEAELISALEGDEPVLVVGHSMAGKTRMTAEVVRERFGNRLILIPDPEDGLSRVFTGLAGPAALPQRVVVWLDDLDRYLAGDGLRVEWLDKLQERGALIVATMRASEHARYEPDSQIRPPQAQLLERFRVVRLDPDDDSGERRQLANQVEEQSLREGIARHGLGEYIGGGYLAVQRFENARAAAPPTGHPLGVAMVRAAVDWRRVGLDVIPDTSLIKLAPLYLPQRYRFDAGEDDATAKAWATALVDETFRLLEPADHDGGTRAFDYIIDHLTGFFVADGGSAAELLGAAASAPERDLMEGVLEAISHAPFEPPRPPSAAERVPEHTWLEAVTNAPAERRMLLAYNAYLAHQTVHAGHLWRQLAEDGDSDEAPAAAYNLGTLLFHQGEFPSAVTVFQQAIDSGHPEWAVAGELGLGGVLMAKSDVSGAMAAFQRAIDSGHPRWAPRAELVLGILRPPQASVFRAIAATVPAPPRGVPSAAVALGQRLEDEGDISGALLAYQRAVDSRHHNYAPLASLKLGVLLQGQSDAAGAVTNYQRAIDSGHADLAPLAALRLADLMEQQEDMEGAAAAYQVALTSGHLKAAPIAARALRSLLSQSEPPPVT